MTFTKCIKYGHLIYERGVFENIIQSILPERNLRQYVYCFETCIVDKVPPQYEKTHKIDIY